MATPDDEATAHVVDFANTYAGLGWRVLPIKPGEKYPAGVGRWQDAATIDPETIRSWWGGLYRGHGIGIALDQLPDGRWAFAVDIDGASHGVDGAATWHDLCATYPNHPPADTVEAVTGGGGRHLIFAGPDEVTNGRLGPAGAGIDIRGHGGQILVEPSIHPNGQPYTWVDGHEPWNMAVADAPGWLLMMLAPDTDSSPSNEGTKPEPARTSTPSGDRPGDLWAASTSWAQILEPDGWTLHHTDRTGEQHWTRPGKERRDGTSATTGFTENDNLKVFTTSHPVLVADETYTKLGYLAAIYYSGDHAAAASYLASTGHHVDQAPADLEWRRDLPPAAPGAVTEVKKAPLDVRFVDSLAHNMPPEPPVIVEGMLRKGEMCVIGAPRAIGKTWFGMNLAQLLAAGEGNFLGTLPIARQANVLYLQGELDQWGSATRWHMLNQYSGRLPHIAESFDRVRIRTVKRRQQTVLGSEEYVDAHIDERIEEAIVEHGIDVVIIDPWATYFAGNENSNDETEAALDKLRDIILRHGTAFVILHHVRKGGDLNVVEPEDLWRGASRLADWASTRVTIVPHYNESQRKSAGLDRREARRCVDVHFLRRSTPTDDRHAKLGSDGWWEDWKPTDGVGEIPADVLGLVAALTADGGTWSSMKVAGKALGIHEHTAKVLCERAVTYGVIHMAEGLRGALVVTLSTGQDVEADESLTAHRADRASARCAVDSDVSAGQSIKTTAHDVDRAATAHAVKKEPLTCGNEVVSMTAQTAPYYVGSPQPARSASHDEIDTQIDDDYLGIDARPVEAKSTSQGEF